MKILDFSVKAKRNKEHDFIILKSLDTNRFKLAIWHKEQPEAGDLVLLGIKNTKQPRSTSTVSGKIELVEQKGVKNIKDMYFVEVQLTPM